MVSLCATSQTLTLDGGKRLTGSQCQEQGRGTSEERAQRLCAIAFVWLLLTVRSSVESERSGTISNDVKQVFSPCRP